MPITVHTSVQFAISPPREKDCPMAPNPLDRLVQWFKLRSEKAASAREAYKWAKSLPKEQVEALIARSHKHRHS